jgi:hypothetical protein
VCKSQLCSSITASNANNTALIAAKQANNFPSVAANVSGVKGGFSAGILKFQIAKRFNLSWN